MQAKLAKQGEAKFRVPFCQLKGRYGESNRMEHLFWIPQVKFAPYLNNIKLTYSNIFSSLSITCLWRSSLHLVKFACPQRQPCLTIGYPLSRSQMDSALCSHDKQRQIAHHRQFLIMQCEGILGVRHGIHRHNASGDEGVVQTACNTAISHPITHLLLCS